MAERVDPIDAETGRWLAALRVRCDPSRAHLERGMAPVEVVRLLDLIDDLANRCRQSERFLVDARTLPTDEFIARVLALGAYRVDLDTGYVYSVPSGTQVGRVNRRGYVQAQLTLDRVHRTVHMHRMVAIAAWGVDAVRDKQIAHLNHDRADNRLANLRAMTSETHVAYDTDQGRRLGRYPSPLSALPCVSCGEIGGYRRGALRAVRNDGTNVGMPGPLCHRCYSRLWKRRRKERHDEQSSA